MSAPRGVKPASQAVLIVLAAALLLSAQEQPPQQPPPTGERITGNERIGWTQQATDAAELADFEYAIYVDGARSQLADLSCSSTSTSARPQDGQGCPFRP